MITQKHARSWAGTVTPENDNGQSADNRLPVKTLYKNTADFIKRNWPYICLEIVSVLVYITIGFVMGANV